MIYTTNTLLYLFNAAEKQNTIYREFVKYLIKIIKEATMIEK